MELLSPVGNFECLKAAVQNGADSVYFGGDLFSARAFAGNFSNDSLKEAIEYAKIRGVKTNLTLNTLITEDEFNSAFELAKNAYLYGIDAIIVQDLGLAMKLIKEFPDLPIHGSTQMTVHNLSGALELQKLGFKRVVLSRELSINEIEYICKNTDIEIECFGHGALCISYSGQCLFSSMIGGRSGNRGKCAQPCRLPYKLFEDDKLIDNGYLLSTRDLCSLDYIPQLLKAGVDCLKIEGRMKSPEYVATVTRIYRKYIDLANSNKEFKIDSIDRYDLLQVFNRGLSSTGHLDNSPNRNLVFKDKPNNMGLPLGKIQKYNKNKGYITIKLQENINIGDTISLQNETGSYTISELMDATGKNISETKIGQLVTIGRMKGNINVSDKVYKMSSKSLFDFAKSSYNGEFRKIPLNAKVIIKKNTPISIEISSCCSCILYKNMNLSYSLDTIPLIAKNRPLTKDIVLQQITKTSSTPFEFKNINIDLDDGLFLPKLSTLNELRRNILEQIEDYAIAKIHRNYKSNIDKDSHNNYSIKDDVIANMRENLINNQKINENKKPKVSVLLNTLTNDFDYTSLKNVDNIYIPLKFFAIKSYENLLKKISHTCNCDMYIYMPTIIKENYKNIFYQKAKSTVTTYNIKGFVISNIGDFILLNDLFIDVNKHFKIIANYTLNVFNSNTVLELKKLGVSTFTISPELDSESIKKLCNYNYINKELIVKGRIPLMNINYCLLGCSNKCYPECTAKCKNNKKYYIQDRLNEKFTIIPDNIQTVTTIYSNKPLNVSHKNYNIDSIRIDCVLGDSPQATTFGGFGTDL